MQVLSIPPVVSAFSFDVVRAGPGRTTVCAVGLAAVRALRELTVAAESAGRASVHLDLSAVTFMDCAFLGALVGAHQRLRAAGGQLVLASLSGPVTRLFSAAHLDSTFHTGACS